MQTIIKAEEIGGVGGIAIKPGLYRMSESLYRSLDAVNFSTLKHFTDDVSPAQFRHTIANPPESSKAARKGTMWHMALLEPARFSETYYVPKGEKLNWSTKDGKLQKAKWEAEAGDKTWLSGEDYTELQGGLAAFKAHPTASALLNFRMIETVAVWVDPDTGLLCKCRVDAAHDGTIFDYKTSDDVPTRNLFSKKIGDFQYHWQAAFYLTGFSEATGHLHRNFVWVVQQSCSPYSIRLFNAPPQLLAEGRRKVHDALFRLKECRESNHWPDYSPEVTEIDMRSYHYA